MVPKKFGPTKNEVNKTKPLKIGSKNFVIIGAARAEILMIFFSFQISLLLILDWSKDCLTDGKSASS